MSLGSQHGLLDQVVSPGRLKTALAGATPGSKNVVDTLEGLVIVATHNYYGLAACAALKQAILDWVLVCEAGTHIVRNPADAEARLRVGALGAANAVARLANTHRHDELRTSAYVNRQPPDMAHAWSAFLTQTVCRPNPDLHPVPPALDTTHQRPSAWYFARRGGFTLADLLRRPSARAVSLTEVRLPFRAGSVKLLMPDGTTRTQPQLVVRRWGRDAAGAPCEYVTRVVPLEEAGLQAASASMATLWALELLWLDEREREQRRRALAEVLVLLLADLPVEQVVTDCIDTLAPGSTPPDGEDAASTGYHLRLLRALDDGTQGVERTTDALRFA